MTTKEQYWLIKSLLEHVKSTDDHVKASAAMLLLDLRIHKDQPEAIQRIQATMLAPSIKH